MCLLFISLAEPRQQMDSHGKRMLEKKTAIFACIADIQYWVGKVKEPVLMI